jgi:membrane-associated phospholipid phosphatase
MGKVMQNRYQTLFATVLPLALLSYFFVDHRLIHYFHESVTSEQFKVWEVVTEYGDSLYILVFALGLMLLYRFSNYLFYVGFYLFTSVIFSAFVTNILKYTIGRSRPIYLLEQETDQFLPFVNDDIYRYNSLPSGHTTTAFAFSVALAIMMPKFRYLFLGLAALAGLSRIALQKHYLSDVLVGALIGTLSAIFLYERFFAQRLKSDETALS